MTTSDTRIDTGELRAVVSRENGGLTIHLIGTADMRVMADLDKLLQSVHAEALSLGAPEVVVDLRELDFMNSSCFKAFVSWLGRLQVVDAAKQYKIRFLSDTNRLWQRRSLNALSCFAVNLVQIET